jgi:uncharacterized protein YyaL (SSP411 family)
MANRLHDQSSPYLLQHKDNPIHWYPWGPEAFAEAKRQNKPIFLSIGYSTCHWCHVMAHESFEDQEVATALNQDFIAIKVDREERPDVDELYMKVLQMLSGGGGWPMSIWMTPDSQPFFAGTYFPKYRFMQLLRRIEQVWKNQGEDLLKDSRNLMSAIAAQPEADPSAFNATEVKSFLNRYINHFQFSYDEVHGGFGQAPKFPQTMNLMLMLRQDQKTELDQARAMVSGTLTAMLKGGIYDHLRGGFHRYSVDEQWLVPHFEKMLYDQAMISATLVEAFAVYQDPEFKRAACETLDYVLREMTDANGGFYSAQDADSLNPEAGHAEEGYFATYSWSELEQALSAEELDALRECYSIKREGHFEGRNILHLPAEVSGADARLRPEIQSAFSKLEHLRRQKPTPHLDDKVIVAWNAWMAWALIKASRTFGEEKYLAAAKASLRFIQSTLASNGKLQRFYRAGKSFGHGMSEDYCATILACIELSTVDNSPEWASFAMQLQKTLDTEFWDHKGLGYFTGDGRDPNLPLRTKDEYDGVHPCANSMAAHNLLRLFALTGKIEFRDKATAIVGWLFAKLKTYPSSLAWLGLALDWMVSEPKVAVAKGETWLRFIQAQQPQFRPYVLWTAAGSGWSVADHKDQDGLYVCREGTCLAPAHEEAVALQQLS